MIGEANMVDDVGWSCSGPHLLLPFLKFSPKVNIVNSANRGNRANLANKANLVKRANSVNTANRAGNKGSLQ